MRKFIREESSIGKLILLIGMLLAVPLLALPFYPEESGDAPAFLIPAAFSILLGLVIGFLTRHKKEAYNYRGHLYASSMTVLAAWGYGILAGAAPFLLAGRLGVVQALFEAVSGWTTTGLSVVDVREAGRLFLFHRSFMQFCGGLGFVMMMIIFVKERESVNLYNAEGHPDRLMPNLGKTARAISLMYCGFLAVGTLAYMVAGMSVFDSINHAMCALSTGGFSTQTDSIGAYGSIAVDTITCILMLIGTTNFAVLLLLVQGRLKKVLQVSEMRFMFGVLAVSVPLAAWSLGSHLLVGKSGESFRQAGFNVISALSTTGFSTMGYQDWPQSAIGIMILLMLIGGGIGSTAGGLKLTRVYIMMRMAAENLKERVSSGRRISIPYYRNAQGRQLIDEKLYKQTGSFAVTYLLLFITGSLLLTETADCDLAEAMFEFSSSLGTVGLSIGITGPATNNATLLVEMAGMLLGRLEIFIVPIGCYCLFDRIRTAGRSFRIRQARPDMENAVHFR